MKALEEADSLEIMTLAAAARRLGVETNTVARLAAKSQFPKPFWLGHRRVILSRDFEKWRRRLGATKDTGHAA